MVLEFIFWLLGKGLVSTDGPCAINLEASSIWGHKWVSWSSLHNLQGNFTLRLDCLSLPAFWVFLSLLLAFLFLFPPLRLFFAFFLFLRGYWLPFGFDDCTEGTFADWVGWDKSVAFPNVDWLIDNWLTCFTTRSIGLVLVQPTMPSACGLGLILGLKLDRGASGIILYKSLDWS